MQAMQAMQASNTGKLFKFSSSGMKKTLHRYNKCQGALETRSIGYEAEKLDSKDADILKDEIVMLQTKQLQLLGLLSVKEKKEQLLMEQLEQSRVQEQRAMLENETLHRQVEELQGFFPSTNRSVPSYLEYCPIERKNCITGNSVASSDVTCSYTVERGNSDTTLDLGLFADHYHKRKEPKRETHSNDSETQLQLL
ncbi:hypothetical protein SLE2022_024800 [Rubroshorea leprosula]